MAGKGGGAWKVAYADFVTAMMAFFMVMWITGQGQKTKEAIASYFQDPFDALHPPGIMGEKANGPSTDQSGRHLPRGPGQGPHKHGKEVAPHVRNSANARTSIGTEVHFADDSAELDATAKEDLADLVPYLAGKPQIIEIRGHASRKPLAPGSPYRDAWDLSYARCLAVRAYLEELKIEPERIRLCQSSPFAPQHPSEKSSTPRTRSRVDVFLLSESIRPAIPPPVDDGHGGEHSPAAHGGSAGGHSPHGDAHAEGAHAADGHASDAHAAEAHRPDAHDGQKSDDAGHGSEPAAAPAAAKPAAGPSKKQASPDHPAEQAHGDAAH